MADLIYLVLTGVIALAIGILVGRSLIAKANKEKEREVEEKAKLIIKEAEVSAESIKKDKILQAKEKYIKIKSDFEEEASRKKNQIITNENKLKQKEQHLSKEFEKLNRKQSEVDALKEKLSTQLEVVNKKKADLDKFNEQKVTILEKISNLTADEAREQLIESLKDEAQSKASSHIKDIIAEAKLTATKEAKKIVVETIQRTATEHAIENCVSIFNIESDDIKGKVIGREGRNIRALEAATGVEIIVDDTPEAIIISGFD
ncbi:MAG: Rnase Y domain-containing protein, partial [Bacteroidota bacterium]